MASQGIASTKDGMPKVEFIFYMLGRTPVQYMGERGGCGVRDNKQANRRTN